MSDPNSYRELTDQALDEEIKLLVQLMLAVCRTTRHLTLNEIDGLLDVNCPDARGEAAERQRT